MKVSIFIIILGLVSYMLYMRGYFVINNKRAILYIESRRKNSQGAKFNRCHGYTKRVISLKENKEYLFELDTHISNGGIKVILQNKGKEDIIILEKNCQSAKIWLDEKKYYLVTQFVHADGQYQVHWN